VANGYQGLNGQTTKNKEASTRQREAGGSICAVFQISDRTFFEKSLTRGKLRAGGKRRGGATSNRRKENKGETDLGPNDPGDGREDRHQRERQDHTGKQTRIASRDDSREGRSVVQRKRRGVVTR